MPGQVSVEDHSHPEADGYDEFDDFADLFADDTPAARARGGDGVADPAGLVLRRLSGYMRLPQHRGTVRQLRAYALRPGVSNAAMALATRDIPLDHVTAATQVAALYVHHQPRGGLGFPTALPRLARSFGGAQRGPANRDVRVLIDRTVHTPAAQVLPLLRRLIGMANRGGGVIAWRHLYDSLLDWDNPDQATRIQWSWLFYTPHPADQIRAHLTKGSI